MDKESLSFPQAHRILLNVFEESRKLPLSASEKIVRNRLSSLRDQLDCCENEEARNAFERYLNYFSKRFSDPSMRENFAIDDSGSFEKILAKDPSRYDQLLLLARSHLRRNRRREARFLLRKIAASCFAEAAEAKRLLERLIDEFAA